MKLDFNIVEKFLSTHWKTGVAIGAFLLAIVGTILGQGILFAWREDERAGIQAEAALISELSEYKREIAALVPKYVLARDKESIDSEFEQRLQYVELRDQLISLFSSYNELEAKLSRLENRGARFVLPDLIIPPRPPRLAIGQAEFNDSTKAGDVALEVKVRIEPQEDEVQKSATNRLLLIVEQFDDSALRNFYDQTCKLGVGRYCTFQAELQAERSPRGIPDAEDRELYEKGCKLGDRQGCLLLAFDDFRLKDYLSAVKWLAESCRLYSADGCGFLGTLQVSKLLGTEQDLLGGRASLEKACEWQSKKGCYALAVLHVSGLIDRDARAARASLDRSCDLGLREACDSLARFEDFQNCEFMPDYSEDHGAEVPIECTGS